MEYIMLKDVCAINMGQSPDSSSYNDDGNGLPFFQGNADFGERYPVTRKWCSVPTKIAKPEDILISVRAPIGALNYAREKCCIGRGLAALTPDKSKVSPEFIFWLLKAKNIELNNKGTGSTFKAIGRNVLEETQVPNVPLTVQLEYSQVLERIYAIIQSRKMQLQKLDNLVKARFVELFGTISEVVPLSYYITGLNAGKSLAGEEENPNKVLKTGAVSYDYFDATQIKNLPIDYEPQESHHVKTGDVIISRMNTAELVGATAYVWSVPEHIYLPDRLWRADVKETANPIFVWQVLIQNSTKESIRRIASGTSGSMKNISKSGLLEINVVKAPINLQDQFAIFVEQTVKSKAVIQKALDETQLLFNSVMQEYFG